MDREYASPLDVAGLARAALMSTAHFSRQFRATYGETPYSLPDDARIERAKALLRLGDQTVTEVCFAVGLYVAGLVQRALHASWWARRRGLPLSDHSALVKCRAAWPRT